MGGSNGGSFSDGDSTEVPLNNKRDINDNLMLGSPELEAENDIHQATLDEIASNMLGICSSLRTLVDLVQKQGERMDEQASNVKRIRSILGRTIDKVGDNVSRTNEMLSVCSELARKFENIEKMFIRTPPPSTSKSQTNPTPVHYNDNACASKDDISNIVLLISSDKDEDENIPKRTRTQIETVDPYKTSSSAGKKTIAKTWYGGKKETKSTEPAGSGSKMKQKISNSNVECITGRKLSFVPSPKFNTLKFIKTNFPVTPQMNLTTEQAHISAYVFHPFNNPEESLFKVGDFEGLRKEFQSMCPSVTIHDRIVHMMAMKITWNQKRVSSPTKWTLPPAFVRVVKMGLSIEDLVSEFADYWMPPFENLSHICVPIETSCGLWYLMVASIADKQLFHIAPYFEKQDIYPRQHVEVQK
ncbi:hypothetical protein P8452_09286 [Trifolium repens]|nr:hypothetical protein P8452_09286 [Trifolium repens]